MKHNNGALVGCANCGNPYEYHRLKGCTKWKEKTNGESKISYDHMTKRFEQK